MPNNKTSSNKSPAAEKAKAALEMENNTKKNSEDTKKQETSEQKDVDVKEVMRNLTEEGASPSQDRWDMENLGYDRPLPRNIRMDHTFFPGCQLEFRQVKIYDRKACTYRPIGRPQEYVYLWGSADPNKVASLRTEGWKFCLYRGGDHSGLEPGGFDGTDMFEEWPDGRVRNGDTFLMFMPRRMHEKLLQEEEDMKAAQEAKPVTDFMNDSYKSGIRGFIEDDFGTQIPLDEQKEREQKGFVKHIYN